MKKSGFTLIELLLVIAILGLLLVVGASALLASRKTASDRVALAHAHNVFKVAWTHLAETPNATLVVGDCTQGYVAGSYSIPPPGGSVRACTVRDRGDGTPEVEVTSTSRRVYRLPVP